MTDGITELRKVQLELLEAFISVCEQNSLKWYAFFGTLLGIQRNEGYLPWDDDIDVAMPLPDYLKLCEYKDRFDPSKYYLQTPLDRGLNRFAGLYKNGTTALREDFIDCLKNGGHLGIHIDIIPLSELPGMGAYHTPTMAAVNRREAVYLKSWFEPAGYGLFEGVKVRVPAASRKVLTECYGDWAWPNGVRDSRSVFWFFDTKKGYDHYIRRFTGMLDDIEDKKIVLFGAADSLRIWLERFELKDQVLCVFDNDPGKWGQKAYDLEIRNPAELPQMINDDIRIIIVSLWHQEIGRQLEKMGIDDYYVYIDDYYDEKIGNKVVRREDLTDGERQIPKWE